MGLQGLDNINNICVAEEKKGVVSLLIGVAEWGGEKGECQVA